MNSRIYPQSVLDSTASALVQKANPIIPSNHIKRNAPCPCNSGKKFKNCCINKNTNFDSTKKDLNLKHTFYGHKTI
jgi:hypothetical protein